MLRTSTKTTSLLVATLMTLAANSTSFADETPNNTPAAKLPNNTTGRDGNWRSSEQGAPSIDEATKAVAKDPKDAKAQNDFGWALRQNGDKKGAELHLKEAVRLQNSMSQAHSNLSVVYLDLGKKVDSLVEARRAVEIDSTKPVYRVVLGNALTVNGKLAEAAKEYESAVSLQPDYQNALYHLGNCLFEQGQKEAARLKLEQALKLDPEDERAMKLLRKCK